MNSRTRVPRWTPPFVESLRLIWRPAVAYLAFTGLGSVVLLLTVAFYAHESGRDVVLFMLGLAAGFIGVVLGQLVSVLRVRALPVFIVGGICIMMATYMMALASPPGGEYLAVPLVFFCFAFPCGLLSLMHRYELFASFWPAVGWIGGVFVIINEEGRVHQWQESKVTAWLPIPLIYLACFLVLWLLYLAAKQAARVEMWQALSGAAGRRIHKKERRRPAVGALPRKNILPILFVAALLFGVTAVLAPYLWRTGRGEREKAGEPEKERESPRKPPPVDGDGIMKQMQQLANAAKETLPKLWPLLLLLVLYRPTKRALLLTHLKSPIVPTPPSERIDNLWEYVRIAAEDAGVVPTSADSVEQLIARFPKDRVTPALMSSAEIYVRTRYGFTVQKGDAIAMRGHANDAAKALRKDLGPWVTVKNWWRPLS